MDKPEEEDKETESNEDRGESNENQVTKMFRWWREEKHLEKSRSLSLLFAWI